VKVIAQQVVIKAMAEQVIIKTWRGSVGVSASSSSSSASAVGINLAAYKRAQDERNGKVIGEALNQIYTESDKKNSKRKRDPEN